MLQWLRITLPKSSGGGRTSYVNVAVLFAHAVADGGLGWFLLSSALPARVAFVAVMVFWDGVI